MKILFLQVVIQKAVDQISGNEMHAEIFEYNIEENIITARQNVIYENKSEKYIIYSEFMSYIKNQGKIFTQGKTNASIDPKYKIVSTDVIFLEEKKEFSSKKETQIYDEINYYSLDNFIYSINNQTLKGKISLFHQIINCQIMINFIFLVE